MTRSWSCSNTSIAITTCRQCEYYFVPFLVFLITSISIGTSSSSSSISFFLLAIIIIELMIVIGETLLLLLLSGRRFFYYVYKNNGRMTWRSWGWLSYNILFVFGSRTTGCGTHNPFYANCRSRVVCIAPTPCFCSLDETCITTWNELSHLLWKYVLELFPSLNETIAIEYSS